MAVAAATSFLFEELSKKLASVAIEQFGRLLGVRRDLDNLKNTLTAIQAVILDAEEKAVKDKTVLHWVAKLRDAAYDADDLLDEFQIEFERRKGEIQQDSVMFRKVRTFFSRSNPLLFRISMSSKLKTIAEKLDMIAEERSRYHLTTMVDAQPLQPIEDRMTDAVIDETKVYGREDDVKKIVNLLLETETDSEDLSVVTIVGMGGLGKTTLAQLAFNHKKLVEPEGFNLKIWVCVSDTFDILSIGRAIIEYVTKQRCDLSVWAPVANRVQEILARKKFLLVLDDVWNENQTEWEKLRKLLLGGAKGSKTIVTTRSDKVASIMATNIDPYHLGRLLEDDCWKLFKNRAFSTGDTERYPSLEAVGREIVAKCRGSPLAAKALGSLMRFKRGIQEWVAVRDSNTWISTEEGDRVMASLRLSYNHLSTRLKQCFAYCSIFPKDSRIDRDDLILQWIAQGFIPSNANSRTVDVGNEYFNNLVMMSFLEKYSRQDSEIKKSYYYKMHDLVHDLTQSVAGDEYFIRYADQKEPAPQRYRFCSLVGTLKASQLEDFFQESRKTRALRLLDSQITDCAMFTTRLRRLRVLDIGGGSQIKELSGSINKLKHLRYLRINGNKNISELPNSIGGLRNLQALIISECNNLGSLPQSFTSLQRLVTLDLSECNNLGSLPQSFTSLQRLVTLDLSGCSKLNSLPESLCSIQSLLTLSLKYCDKLVSLPESIGKLSNLRTLQLDDCSELVSLPGSLDSLQSLLTLSLKYCSKLVSLPESLGKLANLRTLQLDDCRSLVSSLPESLDSLQSLETLSLERCSKLVSLPESIGKLANLRTLQLEWCSSLVSLPQSLSNLSNLQELDLRHCSKIAELPEGMANMTSLRHLKNRGMRSLKGMPSGMGQMRSLETLERFVVGEGSNHSGIAEMEHLNLTGGVLLELSHLENVKCPKDAAKANLKEKQNLRTLFLEWSRWSDSHSLIQQQEEVLAELMPHPNLERLFIDGYPGIKLPESALPNLVELYLRNMPNLEEWPAYVLLYPRLVVLVISNCPKMHISSSNCILPASVEELPSPSSPPPPLLLPLRKLMIERGSPDVWNGLQYICSVTLEELTIRDSPDMVDLPEAIRRFTSLRRLYMYSCPNLARLPEWLADLTSLRKLRIFRCSPILKERCEKDTGGEDWPKIAHIPRVKFY